MIKSIALALTLFFQAEPVKADPLTDSTPLRYEVGVQQPFQELLVKEVHLSFSDPDRESGLPIIICLHAIGHGGRDFEAFRSYFRGRYRVITLDWPGQGRSDSDSQPVSITRYTELLTAFTERLRLKNFVLFGNSIGGGVALKYAYQNPSKVSGLILSDPAGLDSGGFLANVFVWWIERKMHQGSEHEVGFGDWFKSYYSDILTTEAAQPERERIVASAYEIAPVLEQAWHSFRQPEGDLRPLIGKIKTPVFFAWARGDQYVQWSRSKVAVESFANRRVLLFEGGHAPFLEVPQIFNPKAEEFLVSLKW